MSVYLAKRLATLFATLWFTSAAVFLVLEVLPGDPALLILGLDAQADTIAALHRKLGLDRPPLERYLDWVAGMFAGDFGTSYAWDEPVWRLVAERLQLTVPLALLAMTLTVALALGFGIFAAARHNRLGDTLVMGLSQLGISIPSFWFGILLILLFAVELGWFSAGGFPGWGNGFWAALKALLLPALALGLVQAAILARVTRSAILEVAREDFVRTARAKGLTRNAVLWRHVLRNALVPVVTIMGLQFGNLLTGTIVIEQVFSLPGLGRLVFQAIQNRDLIVIRNVVVLFAFIVVFVNFAVDLLYAAIDPRLQASDA